MKKYRIEYEREKCIGAAACASIDEENRYMDEDGKADLKEDKEDTKNKIFFRDIDESEFKKWKATAELCPVTVIHIIDLETGKRII